MSKHVEINPPRDILSQIIELKLLKSSFQQILKADLESVKKIDEDIQVKKKQHLFSKATEQQAENFRNSRDATAQIIDSIDAVLHVLENQSKKEFIDIDFNQYKSLFTTFLKSFNIAVDGQLNPLHSLKNVFDQLNVINGKIIKSLTDTQSAFKSIDEKNVLKDILEWNDTTKNKLVKKLESKLTKEQIDYAKEKLKELIAEQESSSDKVN
jgi:hypothetical protein